VADTSSIEAVSCSVEEFIPETESVVMVIIFAISSIFNLVIETAFRDSSASFLTSSATTANPLP